MRALNPLPFLKRKIVENKGPLALAGGITALEVPSWNQGIIAPTTASAQRKERRELLDQFPYMERQYGINLDTTREELMDAFAARGSVPDRSIRSGWHDVDTALEEALIRPSAVQYGANLAANTMAAQGFLRGNYGTKGPFGRIGMGLGLIASAPLINLVFQGVPVANKFIRTTDSSLIQMSNLQTLIEELDESIGGGLDQVNEAAQTIADLFDGGEKGDEGVPGAIASLNTTINNTAQRLNRARESISFDPLYYGVGALGGGLVGRQLANWIVPDIDSSQDDVEERKREARRQQLATLIGMLGGAGIGALGTRGVLNVMRSA